MHVASAVVLAVAALVVALPAAGQPPKPANPALPPNG